MTDPALWLHQGGMPGASSTASPADARLHAGAAPTARASQVSFLAVYDAHFPFVWRSVQRLGVRAEEADDAVQEVFVVVHRRLAEFEARSTLRTWLYAIAVRVARLRRQRAAREGARATLDAGQVTAPEGDRPDRRAEDAEAARLVLRLLEGMADDLREVFVLADLELPSPEIAEALELNVNTVYSRLRLARAAFAEAAARHRAQDGWRMR